MHKPMTTRGIRRAERQTADRIHRNVVQIRMKVLSTVSHKFSMSLGQYV